MFRSRKGQSLVEAIVAIGIAVSVITGLVVLAVGAVRTATLSRNRTIAVQYAQEGMEALRSIRDRNFDELPTSGNRKLQWNFVESRWEIHPSPAPPGESLVSGGMNFQRSFTVSTAFPASISKPKFTLTVTWSDSAGAHDVTLITYLADWR